MLQMQDVTKAYRTDSIRTLALSGISLSVEAGDFLANALVKQTLTEQGQACLPLILFDGRIVARGVYPTRAVLAEIVGARAEPQATGRVLPVRPSGGKCCC